MPIIAHSGNGAHNGNRGAHGAHGAVGNGWPAGAEQTSPDRAPGGPA